MRFLRVSALVAFMLFSSVLLLALLTMRGLPAAPRGGGVAGATMNGDVNCDGKVNIGDAILIIQWQFKGGAAPCALAQEETVLEKLNALGDQIAALQTSVAANAPTWPPKPENVVSMFKVGNDSEAGNEAYIVPEGKVFVLMNLTVRFGNGQYGSSEIWEKIGSQTTLKVHRMGEPFVSALGVTFAPGSTVLAKLADPDQGPSSNVRYSFLGYLVDA